MYKNKQESGIFYLVKKDAKVKILLSPTLPPPYFCRHSLKRLPPTLPKLMNWILLSAPPLSSNPDNPPEFGTCTNPETTVCIAFRINGIASGAFLFLIGIIGNSDGKSYAKQIAFYKTHSGLGLSISTAYNGSHVTVANDDSTLIYPDYRFPTQKSNCTILNRWHIISVTWSNRKDLSNCWFNGEKLITFNIGNVKGSDHCFIGDLGLLPSNTYLTGCIGEIIGFYRSLTDTETSNIHQYLMIKWGI